MNIASVFLTIFINYASLFLRYSLNPNPRYLVINKPEEYEKAERAAEEKNKFNQGIAFSDNKVKIVGRVFNIEITTKIGRVHAL